MACTAYKTLKLPSNVPETLKGKGGPPKKERDKSADEVFRDLEGKK